MPPHPTISRLECLETTMQDVDRSIHVPVQYKSTVQTGMSTLRQVFLYKQAALRTHLGRVARVYQNGNLGWAIGTVLH